MGMHDFFCYNMLKADQKPFSVPRHRCMGVMRMWISILDHIHCIIVDAKGIQIEFGVHTGAD